MCRSLCIVGLTTLAVIRAIELRITGRRIKLTWKEKGLEWSVKENRENTQFKRVGHQTKVRPRDLPDTKHSTPTFGYHVIVRVLLHRRNHEITVSL
jgi:hypothetical protein